MKSNVIKEQMFVKENHLFFFSLSIGVKWCQIKDIDLLISIRNVGLKGKN